MTIPEGIVELTVVGIVGFIFRTVFGLIGKNEAKSDEADQRLEGEIKDLRNEVKTVESRGRDNDRDHYKTEAKIREDVAFLKGKDAHSDN